MNGHGPSIRRRRLVMLGAAVLAEFVLPRSATAQYQHPPARHGKAFARDFGAIGDGRTNDHGALVRALNSGQFIDGEHRSYAVAGDIVCDTKFAGLANAHLIQVDPAGSSRRRTLSISNATNFLLENVQIDRGGTGAEVSERQLIDRTGGLFIFDSKSFVLRRPKVWGGGIGSAVALVRCSDFAVNDCDIHDLWYRLDKHPVDDAIHGLFASTCRNFTITNARVRDIGGTGGANKTHDNNRGFGITGCSDFQIVEADIRRVGQGIDLSGSSSNKDFRISKSVAEDCHSWAFKFANGPRDGIVEDSIARRSGLGGFVVSAQGESNSPYQALSIAFSKCLADEVTGQHRGTSFGFGVLRQKPSPSYPRDIAFRSCVASTKHSSSRMDYGFFNDVPNRLTEGRPNKVIDCHSIGSRKGDFYGFDN